MSENTRRSATYGTLVAAGQALTGAFVAFPTDSPVITCSGYDQLSVILDYTKGDETNINFKVQFSDTKTFTDAYERIYANVDASGVQDCLSTTFKRTTTGKIEVPIAVGRWPYCKILFSATAGTPTGTFGAKYILTNVER